MGVELCYCTRTRKQLLQEERGSQRCAIVREDHYRRKVRVVLLYVKTLQQEDSESCAIVREDHYRRKVRVALLYVKTLLQYESASCATVLENIPRRGK